MELPEGLPRQGVYLVLHTLPRPQTRRPSPSSHVDASSSPNLRSPSPSHSPSSFTNAKVISGATIFSSSPSSFSIPLVLLFLVLSLTHPQDDDTTGYLQKMRAQVGSFCLVATGIFIVAEIFCCCMLGLCIPTPVASTTSLSSFTLAVAAPACEAQGHRDAIEELADFTILRSDKTLRSPRTLRLTGGRF
ncbi:hypothetical protein DFH08DRAFT_951987 [Mycena albidolilacea]|uniref:Uncharacterized protein n=1 Tax=Mycena albidolilacea TaxID=1033008 RepID=A0AAD7AKW5_9AGAR|nr:hypothetical protein DFH08DRAFT_951987 [Mycena albidolilacea]